MVSVALKSLADDKGSSESAISACIQSTFDNLPWAHDRLLPYYLRKLVTDGELTSPSPDHYQLPLQPPPSLSPPIRRRGRPRLHPSNPNPNPNPRFTRSHRGRSRPPRRRGRPRKISVEDKLLVIAEKGLPPVRRARGRSRVRRGTGRLGLGSSDGIKEQFLEERSHFDTAKSGKVPTFLTSEFFEHDDGKPVQGEAISLEVVDEKLVEGISLLSDEQHENEHGLPLAAAEDSKDGDFQSVPGVGIADSKVEEVVVIPPDEEEVENVANSRKKRRLEGKRRSLRLWFES